VPKTSIRSNLMNADILEIIHWFADLGQGEYPMVSGTLAMLDVQRLKSDRDYGLSCFLTYMGARAGAAKGCVPAWIKAVGKRSRGGESLPKLFKQFYHGKVNKPRNPMWDEERLSVINVPACVERVKRGELSTAFAELKVRGGAHKIRALFLRDLIVFTGADPADPCSWTIADQYLYCQPMDSWVEFVSGSFKDLDDELLQELPPPSRYDLSRSTMLKASRMISLALKAGVSPLKLNQGVWFFAAHVAPDQQRLRTLLSARRLGDLKEELELMRGFLPSDTVPQPWAEALVQAKLLPEADQLALATWLKAEVSDERNWQRSFAASQDWLGELADDALAEYRAGRMQVLDPDKL
jgi:hypothetical protein